MLKNSSLFYIFFFIILSNILSFVEEIVFWGPLTFITMRSLNAAFIPNIYQIVY